MSDNDYITIESDEDDEDIKIINSSHDVKIEKSNHDENNKKRLPLHTISKVISIPQVEGSKENIGIDILNKFLDKCREVVKTNDIEFGIRKIHKKFSRANPSYVNSREFVSFILRMIQNIPNGAWVCMKEVRDALVHHSIKDETNQSTDAIADGTDIEQNEIVDQRTRMQIVKLEKALKQLHVAITALEAKEVDFEDSDIEDSSYIKVSRYKARFSKIYDKLCKLKKEFGDEKLQRIHFSGTKYRSLNRAIEKFYNETKKFPDFQDILRVVKIVNDRENLGLLEIQIYETAKTAFVEFGKTLKSKREYETHNILLSYLPDESVDPAEGSEELQEKLEENKRLNQHKIDEIINKYAIQQDEERLEPVEVLSNEESSESETENEDDANSDNLIDQDEEELEPERSIRICTVKLPDVTKLPVWNEMMQKSLISNPIEKPISNFQFDQPCCSKSLNDRPQKRVSTDSGTEDQRTKKIKLTELDSNQPCCSKSLISPIITECKTSLDSDTSESNSDTEKRGKLEPFRQRKILHSTPLSNHIEIPKNLENLDDIEIYEEKDPLCTNDEEELVNPQIITEPEANITLVKIREVDISILKKGANIDCDIRPLKSTNIQATPNENLVSHGYDKVKITDLNIQSPPTPNKEDEKISDSCNLDSIENHIEDNDRLSEPKLFARSQDPQKTISTSKQDKNCENEQILQSDNLEKSTNILSDSLIVNVSETICDNSIISSDSIMKNKPSITIRDVRSINSTSMESIPNNAKSTSKINEISNNDNDDDDDIVIIDDNLKVVPTAPPSNDEIIDLDKLADSPNVNTTNSLSKVDIGTFIRKMNFELPNGTSMRPITKRTDTRSFKPLYNSAAPRQNSVTPRSTCTLRPLLPRQLSNTHSGQYQYQNQNRSVQISNLQMQIGQAIQKRTTQTNEIRFMQNRQLVEKRTTTVEESFLQVSTAHSSQVTSRSFSFPRNNSQRFVRSNNQSRRRNNFVRRSSTDDVVTLD